MITAFKKFKHSPSGEYRVERRAGAPPKELCDCAGCSRMYAQARTLNGTADFAFSSLPLKQIYIVPKEKI